MSRVPLRVAATVSTKWLADRIHSRAGNFRVLDASWHMPLTKRNARQEYNRDHIPSAQFFDIDECCDKDSSFDHMLPSASNFEEYVGKLGINNSTHVVVYDNNATFGMFSAQRVWWTFRVFGHKLVSVLDGGFPLWIQEDRPLTEEVQKVSFETFHAQFKPEMVRTFEDVERNLVEKKFVLVDARSAGRFEGTAPEPRPGTKPGHIPDAVNIPFNTLLSPNTKMMRPPEELKEVFDEAGVDLTQPLVASCGSGVTACMIALAAYQLGCDNVPVYDGAWTEWYKRARHEHKIGTPI